MKPFLIKVICFSAVVGVVFAFPGYVIWKAKEFYSFEHVVKLQRENPQLLFGFGYNGAHTYDYKTLLLQQKTPTIIALGRSRILQVRESFFATGTTFVNAGLPRVSFVDIKTLISNLPTTSQPQVLLLTLDEEILLGDGNINSQIHQSHPEALQLFFTTVTSARRIYLDAVSGELPVNLFLSQSKKSSNIGIHALLLNNGFRSDGSYAYNSQRFNGNRVTYVEQQVSAKVQSYKEETFSEKQKANFLVSLEEVESILQVAKSKNIHVIGILPPVPSKVFEAQQVRSNIELSSMSDVFGKHSYLLYDARNIKSFGGRDTEFVDALHGTDLMYLKLITEIAKKDSTLRQYVPIKQNLETIKNTKGDFLEN